MSKPHRQTYITVLFLPINELSLTKIVLTEQKKNEE